MYCTTAASCTRALRQQRAVLSATPTGTGVVSRGTCIHDERCFISWFAHTACITSTRNAKFDSKLIAASTSCKCSQKALYTSIPRSMILMTNGLCPASSIASHTLHEVDTSHAQPALGASEEMCQGMSPALSPGSLSARQAARLCFACISLL